MTDRSSSSSRNGSELFSRAMALFDRAMAVAPEQRHALVQGEADIDPAACAQVLAMLAEIENRPAQDTDGRDNASLSERDDHSWHPPRAPRRSEGPSLPGTRVGPYRILRLLKRGGMGEVYQAVREDHYEHPVALKVMKAALLEPVSVERFQQERQILASLQHPNIARIVDGGSLPDGRPFLVMDYVDGLPITEFCDRHRLSLHERLSLFDRMCEAVQHAHSQLVIHRDIKAANVLVTADGAPKLLDFGIAKLLTAGGLSLLDLTGGGGAPSTPLYASPEHLRGAAVQTTSDVYLLGVLLYELLTGVRPFTVAERTARSERELLPILPSQRFTADLAAKAADAPGDLDARAEARRSRPTRLMRQLSGDLDAIITTALRWDSRLRYQSVEALRHDLRRHREHLPLAARPRRLAYVTARFARRYWIAVGGGLLLALSLIGGFVGTFYQWRRAETLRLAAEERDVVGAAFFESTLDRVARALERDPTNVEAQRGFMDQAADYLGRRQAEAGRNLPVIKSVARGYGQVAHLQGDPSRPNVGLPDDALKNFDHAVQLFEYVRASGREDGDALLGISSSNVTMGDIYSDQGNLTLARERYTLAQAAATRLVQLRDDNLARRQLALAEARLIDGFERPLEPLEPRSPAQAPEAAPPRRTPAAPSPVGQEPPASAPVPEPVLSGAAEAGWVQIPAGTFTMGCDPALHTSCRPDEQPAHAVSLPPFQMMRAEVSVGLYARYAPLAGVTVPPQPEWSTNVDLPIVKVAWADAAAVCRAMGGRLPTEAEWEYSARAGSSSEYPWGDLWEARRVNYGFTVGDGHTYPIAAGALSANAYGLFNTLGNVWEWVSDWYAADFYSQSSLANPAGPESGTIRAMRGGSYRTSRAFMRAARRGNEHSDPTLDQVGFRCASG